MNELLTQEFGQSLLEGFGPIQMDIGFDPGPLEPGTTYYWRVDTFYGTWVTGPVLSFTVPAL